MTYCPAVFWLFFFFLAPVITVCVTGCARHACRAQISGLRISRRDSAHAVCWVHLHPRYFPHPLHFGAATLMWVKVMWLFIVEYLLWLLNWCPKYPTLTVFWPPSDPGYNPSEFTSALIIDSPFYYKQNEDISNQGSETEQASEDKGSACPRGPRGPAGPPGIEVGSEIFSCSTADHSHTICNVSVAQPSWFLSAAHLPQSVLERASPGSNPNKHHSLILPNLNLRVPAGDGDFCATCIAAH